MAASIYAPYGGFDNYVAFWVPRIGVAATAEAIACESGNGERLNALPPHLVQRIQRTAEQLGIEVDGDYIFNDPLCVNVSTGQPFQKSKRPKGIR